MLRYQPCLGSFKYFPDGRTGGPSFVDCLGCRDLLHVWNIYFNNLSGKSCHWLRVCSSGHTINACANYYVELFARLHILRRYYHVN